MRVGVILAVVLVLAGVIGFAATHTAFGGSIVLAPYYLGLGGYYWWGTELDFQIPTLGSLEFDKPMVYGGPGFDYFSVGGLANAFAVNFSGELLVPIKSFQFTLFGMNIQPALGVYGEIGYWITGVAGYGYSGLYSNAEPKISFLTIPEKPGALRWYGFLWPFPLTVGIGAYN